MNLFSDCKLSLSRGSVGPEGDPQPGDSGPDPSTEGISRLQQLSAHQMCHLHTKITAGFVLMWFEPCLPPGFVTVGVMFQDCGTAGRVVTPQTPPALCVWKCTAEFPLRSLPCSPCGRSRLQLPDLVLSLLWGLLDQFFNFFFLVLKGMMVFFLKLGLKLRGQGSGHDKDKPQPF